MCDSVGGCDEFGVSNNEWEGVVLGDVYIGNGSAASRIATFTIKTSRPLVIIKDRCIVNDSKQTVVISIC